MRRRRFFYIGRIILDGGVTGECTFEIKTLNPECTCPLTFQNGQVTSIYVTNKYLEDFSKNPNWEVLSVRHYVLQ